MALPSLTLRNTKGSALTYTELDNNFTNLSTGTVNVLVGSTTTTLSLNDTLTLSAGSNITLTGNSATKTVTIASAAGGLSSLVQDPSPTLGGNLNVNGKRISSGTAYIEFSVDKDISLNPATGRFLFLGALNVESNKLQSGSGADLVMAANYSSGGSITLGGTTDSNITVTPNGNGNVYVDSDFLRVGDAGVQALIASNGNANLKLATNSDAAGAAITLGNGMSGVLTLASGSTGYVQIGPNKWPQADGANGQTLITDGAGQLKWVNSGTSYTLTTATTTTLGGIKIGSNLTITGDGTLSATAAYTLTTATASTLGGVKIGSGISITGDGTISAAGGASAETVYAYTFSSTFAPNWSNGTIQTTTITANITSLAFTSPTSGQTITIVATMGGSGSYTLPASSSTLKYANGTRALSTAVGAIDLITISYIGTVYYVSITRGYA